MGAESTELDQKIQSAVERAIGSKFDHVLEDISFRIGQAYELIARVGGGARGTVFAEDLNLPGRHVLTGYTVTPNSPAAGAIAWADLHIVYSGTDYPITNANTNLKYAWWSPTTTPTVLQVSNTKPSLAQGEVLVFMNNGGTPKIMLSDTNSSLPGVVSDGAIDSASILANAVTATQLADGAVGATQLGANAVTAAKLADGAVVRSGQLTNGVVATGALAANAVDATKLADGAVTRSGQLAANVVTSGKVADGAINRTGILAANTVTATAVADGAVNRTGQLGTGVVATTALAANAVDATKLADGAVTRTGQMSANVVTNTQIAPNAVTSASVANGAIVRDTQLGANVVTNTQIADLAVGADNLQSGAVGANKLDILRHVLY
ncbi:hypothetical protein MRBLMI12_000503 [Microbacterium sp. LMI12-1-1.1]